MPLQLGNFDWRMILIGFAALLMASLIFGMGTQSILKKIKTAPQTSTWISEWLPQVLVGLLAAAIGYSSANLLSATLAAILAAVAHIVMEHLAGKGDLPTVFSTPSHVKLIIFSVVGAVIGALLAVLS